MRDPHQVLGVPWNADPRHIKAAYRKLAAEFHPDRNSSPDATDRLKEVVDAYRFLTNPGRCVQQEERYREGPRRSRSRSAAGTMDTAEFRRQQTFWYHFQKLIAPQPSRFHPSHDTRLKLAVALGMILIGLFLISPANAPESLGDDAIVASLILAALAVIAFPYVIAEIPVYSPGKGLGSTMPDWLVECYGWIALLSMGAMIVVSHNFFVL